MVWLHHLYESAAEAQPVAETTNLLYQHVILTLLYLHLILILLYLHLIPIVPIHFLRMYLYPFAFWGCIYLILYLGICLRYSKRPKKFAITRVIQYFVKVIQLQSIFLRLWSLTGSGNSVGCGYWLKAGFSPLPNRCMYPTTVKLYISYTCTFVTNKHSPLQTDACILQPSNYTFHIHVHWWQTNTHVFTWTASNKWKALLLSSQI